MHHHLGIAAAFTLCLTAGACEQAPKGPPLTLRTHPHAMDRYGHLLRWQLADSLHGHEIMQRRFCEMFRVAAALGPEEMRRRVARVEDSMLSTSDLRARYRAADRSVYGQSFDNGGPHCDSLDAIANRDSPIAPADSAIRAQ